MTERVQVYNVLIPEKYIGSDKMERTNYYQVGTAFPTGKEGEGLRIKLAPNVTVSGDLLILPRTAKGSAPAASSEPESADTGHEIPF